jgi:cytidylate kinase
MSIPVVTIDGPSGVGKTAVARGLAGVLGWRWVSAGFLYRALAVDGSATSDLRVDFVPTADAVDDPVVVVDGRSLAERDLVDPQTATRASVLSQDPAVRARVHHALLQSSGPGLVLEGRSMAAAVPSAVLHVYLWANRTEREARSTAVGAPLQAGRDRADRGREVQPLRVRAGMTVWDSSRASMAETVDSLARRTRIAMGAAPKVTVVASGDETWLGPTLSGACVEILGADRGPDPYRADFMVAVPPGTRPTPGWLDAHLSVLRTGNNVVTVGPPPGLSDLDPAERNLTASPGLRFLVGGGNVGMTADVAVRWDPASICGPPPDARLVYVPDAKVVPSGTAAAQTFHVRQAADADDILGRIQRVAPPDRPVVVVDHVDDPRFALWVEAACPGQGVRVVAGTRPHLTHANEPPRQAGDG